MKYNVEENIGVNCITLTDGQKVFDVIYPELNAQHKVELDFMNVRIVASPFLNAAIGQLLHDLTPEDLNKYLKIDNLSIVARPILRRVIENAKAYYNSEEVRDTVDKALERESSDNDD